MLLDVIHVQQRFILRNVTEQTPQRRFSVEYLFAAQIPARVKQQIKGNERRLATMEQQIIESRPATFVQADYFAIQHHSVVREQFADSQREILKRGKCISVA